MSDDCVDGFGSDDEGEGLGGDDFDVGVEPCWGGGLEEGGGSLRLEKM